MKTQPLIKVKFFFTLPSAFPRHFSRDRQRPAAAPSQAGSVQGERKVPENAPTATQRLSRLLAAHSEAFLSKVFSLSCPRGSLTAEHRPLLCRSDLVDRSREQGTRDLLRLFDTHRKLMPSCEQSSCFHAGNGNSYMWRGDPTRDLCQARTGYLDHM